MWPANTMKSRYPDHVAIIYMFCSDVLTERPRLIHVSYLPFSSMSFYPTMYDHVCCTHTCMYVQPSCRLINFNSTPSKSITEFGPIFQALGLLDTKDTHQMQANMDARVQNTPEAEAQRAS